MAGFELTLYGRFWVTPKALASVAQQLSLRYDNPAKEWTEALPLGNGRIGAMLFGGVREEHLQINEDTLWGGGPHSGTRMNQRERRMNKPLPIN